MAFSVNKACLLGSLGRDPEVKSYGSDAKLVRFSLATSDGYKDKSGQWQNKTEWHAVIIHNKHLIAIAEKWLHKGSKVYLEGEIKAREWTDKDGNKRKDTQIVLPLFGGTLVPLDSKNSSESHDYEEEREPESVYKKSEKMAHDDLDDGIPF
jgi:single-strand DNA-binding protein